MSLKQPHILLIFESDFYLSDESNTLIIKKLEEEFTIFHISCLDDKFHKIISENKIHVFITIGSNWIKFNSLFTRYGNKLNRQWLHFSDEDKVKTDFSRVIISCFFNSQIVSPENNTISYFITAYNSKDIIYRPYNSLLQQTYLNWELVIIDDSDNDNGETERIVREIASSDFRVKYFRSKHSGFIGEVKNYAARLCTGYVICELDHDDEVAPDLTKSLHEAYTKDKDLIFVSSNCCELYDDTEENSLYGEIYDFGYGSYVYEWHRGRWRAISQSGNINNTTVSDIVGVPNHIRTWRASALFDIGYNNSALYIADDYELILRTINYCAKNNKNMLHLPIMGYYQYRNRKIGNHTFKRLEQIRKVQSLCSKFYNNSILESVRIIQDKKYQTDFQQNRWDNYEGQKCVPIWNMPWNWQPKFINSPDYIFDDHKVSIVISTYKRKDLLLRAINSCLNQTYQNFEIIIIGDKCPELENFMNNEYNGPKDKIRWFNLYSNTKDGGTTPKNYALRMVLRTNLVCYLDDDNIYTHTHLETLVNKFKENKELGFAFSSMEMSEYKIICREPLKCRVDTSTFMHKKSLLDKYGYWRKHSDAGYAHDYEIVSRWVAGGEKWAATEEVTMIYNMETQSLNNPKAIYEMYDEQNKLENFAIEENDETKNAIFITVFNQDKYVDMLFIMLDSINLYGQLKSNTDILIYTSTIFMNRIKESSYMSDKIIFEINDSYDNIDKACKARLDLFQLESISKYDKILYLDTDIIVKGNLNFILNSKLEDKIYALEEGRIDNNYIKKSDENTFLHDYYGQILFEDGDIEKYEDKTAFSSGIMIFNNCLKIKELFDIIKKDIIDRPYFFCCYDQPYIVHNTIKHNLHNNKLMKKYCVNNNNNINSDKIIHHFPGGPGVFYNKIIKMTKFLEELKQKDLLINKKFTWQSSSITFLENNKMEAFGEGKYEYVNSNKIKAFFGNRIHIIEFNSDYTKFKSIRYDDLENINGSIIDPLKINSKSIPKIIMQTSKIDQKSYIKDMIIEKCIGYEYFHFVDIEIIEFFKTNPIDEFPNIVDIFNSFSMGQHKADLFRYYFLYLKGGIFIDSDAMLEENIDIIISNYDSVFVKSFMQNTHLFNGFICTYPKNPIIYEALKHAYNTDDSILTQHYHYLCEELLIIFNRLNLPNMKIYQEVNKSNEGYGGSIIVNDDGKKIMSHYWQSKIIPEKDILKNEFTKSIMKFFG